MLCAADKANHMLGNSTLSIHELKPPPKCTILICNPINNHQQSSPLLHQTYYSTVNVPMWASFAARRLSSESAAPDTSGKHLTTNTVTQASRQGRATLKRERLSESSQNGRRRARPLRQHPGRDIREPKPAPQTARPQHYCQRTCSLRACQQSLFLTMVSIYTHSSRGDLGN